MNVDLLPVRMINEWVFCPRRAVLEYVYGEWADNEFTEDGRRVHKRVDQEEGAWPLAEALVGGEVARSVWMGAEGEGLTARLDLIEGVEEHRRVRPVDYKRSSAPKVEGGGLSIRSGAGVCTGVNPP